MWVLTQTLNFHPCESKQTHFSPSGLRLSAPRGLHRRRVYRRCRDLDRRPPQPRAGRRIRLGRSRRGLPQHRHVSLGLRRVDGSEKMKTIFFVSVFNGSKVHLKHFIMTSMGLKKIFLTS